MSHRFPPAIKKRLIESWERAEAAGVSRQQIATHFKVSESAVGQWFSPKGKGVSIVRLVDLSRLLDVNLIWLLSGQGNVKREGKLTSEDLELLKRYKLLNEVDRRRVAKRIDELLEDYAGDQSSFRKGA